MLKINAINLHMTHLEHTHLACTNLIDSTRERQTWLNVDADTEEATSYQTVWSYCLSRDCSISCMRRLKCSLQKPSQRHTSQQKSLLCNNISPSNINLKSRNHLLVTGYRIFFKKAKT